MHIQQPMAVPPLGSVLDAERHLDQDGAFPYAIRFAAQDADVDYFHVFRQFGEQLVSVGQLPAFHVRF